MVDSAAPRQAAGIEEADRVRRALDVIIDHLLAGEQPALELIEENLQAYQPRADAEASKLESTVFSTHRTPAAR